MLKITMEGVLGCRMQKALLKLMRQYYYPNEELTNAKLLEDKLHLLRPSLLLRSFGLLVGK